MGEKRYRIGDGRQDKGHKTGERKDMLDQGRDEEKKRERIASKIAGERDWEQN